MSKVFISSRELDNLPLEDWKVLGMQTFVKQGGKFIEVELVPTGQEKNYPLTSLKEA